MKRAICCTLLAASLQALSSASARADSREEHSWYWPLHEPTVDGSGKLVKGRPRRMVFNGFGDYQDFASPIYLHPGIDIMSYYTNKDRIGDEDRKLPDLTVIPVASRLVRIFDHEDCAGQSMGPGAALAHCRMYFRTSDNHFLYYFGHVRYHAGESPGEDEPDVRIRDAVRGVLGDQHDAGFPCTESCDFNAGDLGPMITLFPGASGYDHLHFTIVDRENNYDNVSPFKYLQLKATDYTGDTNDHSWDTNDTEYPVVESLDLHTDGTHTSAINTGGSCGPEVSGAVDVVALGVYDSFRDRAKDDPHYPIRASSYVWNRMAVHRASYTVKNLANGVVVRQGTWYDFTKGPMFCPGPDQGLSCQRDIVVGETHHELPLLPPTDSDDQAYFDTYLVWGRPDAGNQLYSAPPMGLLPTGTENDQKIEAGFSAVMYDTEHTVCDYDTVSPKQAALILTNEWGTDTNFAPRDGVNTNWTPPNGRYQIDVEVADEAGHTATRSMRINVQNEPGTLETSGPEFKDIYLRDFVGDVGATPSLPEASSYPPSPDILLVEVGSPPDESNNLHEVQPGKRYQLWLHVHYGLCNDVSGMQAAFGTVVSDNLRNQDRWHWITVDGDGHPAFQGPANDSDSMPRNTPAQWVGPFDYIPVADDTLTGTRGVMLAAIRSSDDPTSIGDMVDFIGRNNVAWRDIKVLPASNKTAPGTPLIGFQYGDDQEQIKFLTEDASIYELYHTKAPPRLWCSRDLTSKAGAPNSAAVDSGIAAFQTTWNDQQHIFYRSSDTRHDIYELVYANTSWRHNNLTKTISAPVPRDGSPLSGYATTFTTPDQLHVNYIGDDGYIHELWYDTNHTNWQHKNLHEEANAKDCPKARNLVGYTTAYNSQQHIVYIAEDRYIYEYWYDSEWHCNDQLPKVMPADDNSALNGYVTTFTGDSQQHVNFIGKDQNGKLHLGELLVAEGDTSWTFNDLNGHMAPNTEVSQPGALAGYQTSKQQHVDFVDSQNRIWELVRGEGYPNWTSIPLWDRATDMYNGQKPPPVGAGSRLAGYETSWDDIKQQHVIYTVENGEVYELFYYNNEWKGNNLTQHSNPNCQ